MLLTRGYNVSFYIVLDIIKNDERIIQDVNIIKGWVKVKRSVRIKSS